MVCRRSDRTDTCQLFRIDVGHGSRRRAPCSMFRAPCPFADGVGGSSLSLLERQALGEERLPGMRWYLVRLSSSNWVNNFFGAKRRPTGILQVSCQAPILFQSVTGGISRNRTVVQSQHKAFWAFLPLALHLQCTYSRIIQFNSRAQAESWKAYPLVGRPWPMRLKISPISLGVRSGYSST